MEQKALLIRFSGAGIFPETRRSSDKMYDLDGKTNRRNAPVLQVPPGRLDWRHVSNVLHVLMGERPVPSIRKSLLKPDPGIQEAARKAFVAIDTPFDDRGYNGVEMITARKTVKDAWQTDRLAYFLGGTPIQIKGGLLYWARLERLLGETLLNKFLSAVRSVTGQTDVVRNLSAHRAIEILHDNYHHSPVRLFCEDCVKAGRKTFANLIDPQGNIESISYHQGTGSKLNIRIVNSGPENIIRISGTIFVPITSELLDRLSKGCGTATILEGGLAYVDGVEDWSDNLIFDAQPVIEAPIERGGAA